jgi:hypothetical protein
MMMLGIAYKMAGGYWATTDKRKTYKSGYKSGLRTQVSVCAIAHILNTTVLAAAGLQHSHTAV